MATVEAEQVIHYQALREGLHALGYVVIKAAVPGSTRVALLMNSDNPGSDLATRETEAAARSLGLTLHVVQARDPADLDRAFSEILKGQARAVVVMPDPMWFGQRTRIVALAAKSQLPSVGEAREFATAGGLMAYGPRITENFRRSAVYVDKILKGAKPGDLPVEQPTTFELVINLKAKALGLTVPQVLLLRADEVIQ